MIFLPKLPSISSPCCIIDSFKETCHSDHVILKIKYIGSPMPKNDDLKIKTKSCFKCFRAVFIMTNLISSLYILLAMSTISWKLILFFFTFLYHNLSLKIKYKCESNNYRWFCS